MHGRVAGLGVDQNSFDLADLGLAGDEDVGKYFGVCLPPGLGAE